MAERRLYAHSALLPEGWRNNVLFEFKEDGSIGSIETGAASNGAELAGGPVIPAMGNLHSHAFQRAMAGLAERTGPGDDSFWTWRDVMYGFLAKLEPDDLEAIAAQLYLEMLKAGYGTVGEFHYLHHSPGGTPYDDLAEMSGRIIAASEQTGIALTLLPVLYGYSGFGGQEAGDGQRRFLNSSERYAELLHHLHLLAQRSNNLSLGIAPHSLRAVTKLSLSEAITVLNSLDSGAPIHIHIAEQVKEVKDCLSWSGKRPLEWLYENFEVDERWCLVHATHMTEAETTRLAASGAVAGLCPTTEANLGDGLFPAVDFMRAGGTFGIGSDSHISISPIEELRWLEYGQRLAYQARNLLAKGAGASLGANLYREALKGGARALGRRTGHLQEGARADLLVLDQESAILAGKSGDAVLDAFVFSGNVNTVRHVMVGARWLIRDGHHAKEEEIGSRYRQCLERLTA